MFGLFKRKNLKDALSSTRKVKLKGILFEFKKLDVLDYLDGSKVMLQVFDSYKAGKQDEKQIAQSTKKVKSHYIDVFMAAVVKPRLSRKDNEEGVYVEDMFKDWDMAALLYTEIYAFTFGKKKIDTKYLSRAKLVELDFIANRYNKLPSDLLKGNIQDLNFDVLVASKGQQNEIEVQKKAQRESQRRRK